MRGFSDCPGENTIGVVPFWNNGYRKCGIGNPKRFFNSSVMLKLSLGEYASIVDQAGAEFQGIQYGPRGALILFAHPDSRSTLALPQSEFSLAAVLQRLERPTALP